MDFVQFVEKLGLPTAQLVAVVLGIWQAFRWSAKEVIIPARDRHFKFMDTVETGVKAMADSQKVILENQGTVVAEVRTLSKQINCPAKKESQ